MDESQVVVDFSSLVCLSDPLCRNGTLSMSRAAEDTQGTSPAEYRGGFEKGKYHGYGDMK